jgi:hypothetical protein
VPAASEEEVVHEVVGRVTEHRVVEPVWNVTVPVATEGRPVAESVTALPCGVDVGAAVAPMIVAVAESVAVPESPSREAISAVEGNDPDAVADRVAGMVMSLSAVPAATLEEGV